jgi:hypothetical protein
MMRSRMASARVWITDDLVPALDRQLAGDEDRIDIVAILDDLKQVAALFSVELLWSPVIENEEICARKSAQEPRVSSVTAGARAMNSRGMR